MKRKIKLQAILYNIIITSSLVIACHNASPYNQSVVHLENFTSQLSMVYLYDKNSKCQNSNEINREAFENAIYQALETVDYRGDVSTNDLTFKYYDSNNEPIDSSKLKIPLKKLDAFHVDDENQKKHTNEADKDSLQGKEIKKYEIIANSNSKHYAGSTGIINIANIAIYCSIPKDLSSLKIEYSNNKIKELNEENLYDYFNSVNTGKYLIKRHITIEKSQKEVKIIANKNSNRYTGEIKIGI